MGSYFTMKFLILLLFAAMTYAELEGLLDDVPGNIFSGLMGSDDSHVPKSSDDGKAPLAGGLYPGVGGHEKFPTNPLSLVPPVPFGASAAGPGKLFKAAGPAKLFKAGAVVAAPAKILAAKKAAAAAKVLSVPKLKAVAAAPMKFALKKKPKVTSLKPIVYVINKPVPVYHKVPVPKKVFVPKFYPVFKKIPVPKIIPVPFKVPVKKIIPKIVKIPKAVPIPKIVLVKKPVPIAIPYPVPKFYKFAVPKPVPYPKYIPIPIPKKVPKFIPVPIKKIIKVPKPYYVPIKVPHFSASYVRTPMKVNVPNIKKVPYGGTSSGFKPPMKLPLSGYKPPTGIPLSGFKQSVGMPFSGFKSGMGMPQFGQDQFKFLEPGSDTGENPLFHDSVSNLGEEDKELLKLLAGGVPGDKNIKI